MDPITGMYLMEAVDGPLQQLEDAISKKSAGNLAKKRRKQANSIARKADEKLNKLSSHLSSSSMVQSSPATKQYLVNAKQSNNKNFLSESTRLDAIKEKAANIAEEATNKANSGFINRNLWAESQNTQSKSLGYDPTTKFMNNLEKTI